MVEFETRPHIFITIGIEEAITGAFVDKLVDIAILNVTFDPMPVSTNRMMILMTTHGHRPKDLPFLQVDMMGEANLAKEMLRQKAERHGIFLSPILNIPCSKVDNPYGAQAIFTIPQSFLE